MLTSWKSAAGVASAVTKSFLVAAPNPCIQQARNTMVLKRKYDLPLKRKGGTQRKMTHKYFIYELVENTSLRPKPPIDIILTQYVEGYGEKGEKLSMKQNKAYNHFLLPGLAVYASPANIEKYLTVKEDQVKTYSSKNAPLTMKIFSKCCLTVNMSVENPWVLEKWHIRANFRRYGYIVSEDAITMPEKEISGPNLDYENKEFYITLTINKTEQVKVRCKLHHNTYDLSKELPNIDYTVPTSAIFPEDQEVLDSLPLIEIKKKDKKK